MFIIQLNVGSTILIVGLAMWASAFKPTFWTQYQLFSVWTAFASSFCALITSCLKKLFVLACSTASSAACITWSNTFLWCFSASFSNCSQHSTSPHDLPMMSTGVSSSRFLWLFWGDSLWDLSLGSLDEWCIGPSCSCPSLTGHECFLGGNPGLLSLVWWVCDWPSCEQLVSVPCFLQLFLNVFLHWWRFAMEACVSAHPSSALFIASAIISSKHFATLFTLDVNSSQVSSSSDLVVGWQCTECDHKQSSLSFHLKRLNILSHSLGGSCPDPPCAVLSGTALPLPLSGSTTSYSSLTLLILGDSTAPAFDPLPAGGGVVIALWSAMLLVLSSWDCELMVTFVRFTPDCTPMLLFDSLGHTTFHFAIGCHRCEALLIELLCDKLSSSSLLQ